MRTSLGQKMQRPGQGKGLVSIVTGVTPEMERVRFLGIGEESLFLMLGEFELRFVVEIMFTELGLGVESSGGLGMTAEEFAQLRHCEWLLR